jgi:hypothetical protein
MISIRRRRDVVIGSQGENDIDWSFSTHNLIWKIPKPTILLSLQQYSLNVQVDSWERILMPSIENILLMTAYFFRLHVKTF